MRKSGRKGSMLPIIDPPKFGWRPMRIDSGLPFVFYDNRPSAQAIASWPALGASCRASVTNNPEVTISGGAAKNLGINQERQPPTYVKEPNGTKVI